LEDKKDAKLADRLELEIGVLMENSVHNRTIIEGLYEHRKAQEETTSTKDLVRKLNSFKYNIWKEFEPTASAGELPGGQSRPQRDNFELLPNHETPSFTPEKL
jgi:hypothetical protein